MEEGQLIEPQDLGVEVLLNAPWVTIDLPAIDDLIETGEAVAIDGPVPDEEVIVPRTYLMRSSFDPSLGVVIRTEDGYDNTSTSLSVSILIPGVKVIQEREQTRYSFSFNGSGPMEPSYFGKFARLGFTDLEEYSDDGYYMLNFRYNTTELGLTILDQTVHEMNNSRVTLDLTVFNGSSDEDLRSKVSSILEILNVTADLWGSFEKSYLTLDHIMVRADPGLCPDVVDWPSHMRVQLEYLTEIGLVSGLTGDDILSISSKCTAGVLGFERRLFFHNETMEWTRHDSTVPGESLLFPDQCRIFGNDDYPDVSVPRTDMPDGGISGVMIALIAGGVALLILGSLLFQRVDRAARLNNVRRSMILERIRQMPGIYFSALMKDLDLKPGVASYHINKLEKAEQIKSFQDGMYRRFYLYDEKVEMKIMLSDLQKIIVHTINEEPGISQMDISRLIGKSKVVINYHIRFLRDLNLLVLERDGRETHCFLTPQGARVSKA